MNIVLQGMNPHESRGTNCTDSKRVETGKNFRCRQYVSKTSNISNYFLSLVRVERFFR